MNYSNMIDLLYNVLVVFDNGFGIIRVGFVGDDVFKCYFLLWVGRLKYFCVLVGVLEGEVFIG